MCEHNVKGVTMAHYKHYSYNQTKMIPIDFRNQLQSGTFEFALNQIIDKMDVSFFDDRYHNDITGAPAYDPRVLLKIVLFAYSRGITSSREIERNCRENVVFMALSADSHPHFTTIAKFISSMETEITPLFRSVLMICSQEKLIGRQMFAIDGCKISSNCAKEWSGTRAGFERRKGKLDKSIKLLLRKHRETDSTEDSSDDDDKENPSQGMREKEREAIERLRAKAKRIDQWLAENEDKRGPSGNIIQSNLIDNESAKMPCSHGVVQGYNGVATVDDKHQIIVSAEAFGSGSEKRLLEPMLKDIRRNFTAIGDTKDVLGRVVLLADNGYHSEANARLVLEEGIDAYLPDAKYRKRDPDFATADRHKRPVDRKGTTRRAKYFQVKDFKFNKDKTKLICPAGNELYLKNKNFQTAQGWCGTSYMAKKTDCRQCNIRGECLRNPKTIARQVTITSGMKPDGKKSFTRLMMERFDTALGRYLYSRRLGIVEPVFGNICHALGLQRFSLRGGIKVDIQWKLFCIVHNLKKIQRFSEQFAT